MTAFELFQKAKLQLKEKGVESPEFDAFILSEHFLGLSRSQMLAFGKERAVPSAVADSFNEAVLQRCGKRPLQYIIGSWEFMGHELSTGEGVLIPREDTEVLVRQSAWHIKPDKPIGADLCSGTGAVAIGLCSLIPKAQVFALELYEDAFSYLKENAKNFSEYNIIPLLADVLDKKSISSLELPKLDFVVSNPPYIESSALLSLQEEVQKEPQSALDGGADGLDFYRGILNLWTSKLKKGGVFAVEIGDTQAAAVSELFKNHGLANITVEKDLANLDRAVIGIMTSNC